MEYFSAVRAIMKSRRKLGGDDTMTEKELLEQIGYHEMMRDHQLKMIGIFKKRLHNLRVAVAKKTSEQVTTNIIERLKQ